MDHIVFYLFAILSTLGLAGYFFQLVAVRSKFAQTQQKSQSLADTGPLSPISVIKPLKGLDDNLFDNLSSFCTQEYPGYEIIFSLQDSNDPAYKVARKVKDRNPECDITVLVEHC